MKEVSGLVILSIVAILLFFVGVPHYRVWTAGMAGKAALMKAEQEKKIQIEQAKAEARIAELEAELELGKAKNSGSGINPIKLEPLAIYPL